MADVPILWAINPQGLFLALKSWLYTKKCNRLLVISPYMKTGIKKIYCLIFFQLYLGALTCRTNILFKNIFKDIFRQLLNCKILSKIKLYLNSPQIENRFCQNYVWHCSQYVNLCPLWNPRKVTDSMDALLAAWNRSSHWNKLKWQLEGYTDLLLL